MLCIWQRTLGHGSQVKTLQGPKSTPLVSVDHSMSIPGLHWARVDKGSLWTGLGCPLLQGRREGGWPILGSPKRK